MEVELNLREILAQSRLDFFPGSALQNSKALLRYLNQLLVRFFRNL